MAGGEDSGQKTTYVDWQVVLKKVGWRFLSFGWKKPSLCSETSPRGLNQHGQPSCGQAPGDSDIEDSLLVEFSSGREHCFRRLVILLVVHILTPVLCLSVSNLSFVHSALSVPHKLQPPQEENMQPLAIFYQDDMLCCVVLTSSVLCLCHACP